MRKRYVVRLTDEEKSELTDMTKRGKTGPRKVRRAHTLLLADDGRTDREIAENLHICISECQPWNVQEDVSSKEALRML